LRVSPRGYLRGNQTLTKEAEAVGIGGSIFLIALGAILAFATDFDVAGVDEKVIGIILMIAGALGLLFTTLILGRRRTGYADETVVREREVY
jgi:hypothetical protein